MALVLRRNGATNRPDAERLVLIRKRIRTELVQKPGDLDTYIVRLKELVQKNEVHYKTTSEAMVKALESHQIKETKDVQSWVMAWHVLHGLRKRETHTTGTR